jgi:hypothetical protein
MMRSFGSVLSHVEMNCVDVELRWCMTEVAGGKELRWHETEVAWD